MWSSHTSYLVPVSGITSKKFSLDAMWKDLFSSLLLKLTNGISHRGNLIHYGYHYHLTALTSYFDKTSLTSIYYSYPFPWEQHLKSSFYNIILFYSTPTYQAFSKNIPRICGALRDLVPCAQFKNVKNTHGWVLL